MLSTHLYFLIPAIVLSIATATHAQPSFSQPDFDREALAQALLAEIAVREHRLPEAWNAYMQAAERAKDPVLAERAYALAKLSKDAQSWEASKKLLGSISPENALILLDNALQSAKSNAWKVAGEELTHALEQTKTPFPFLQEFIARTEALADKEARYNTLQNVCKTLPSNAQIELLLAQCAHVAKRPKEALSHALRATKFSPDDPQVLLESADYQFGTDPKATQERLQAFLKRHPKNSQVLIALAKTHVHTQAVAKALPLLKKAVETTPENPQTLFFAAAVAEEAKHLDLAQTWFNRFVTRVTQTGDKRFRTEPAMVRLGAIALANNKPQEALDWLSRVQSGKQYIAAQVTRAQILESLGKADESCKALLDIRTNDTKEKASFHNICAKIFVKAKRNTDALKHLKAAQKEAPNHPPTLYESAETAHRIGEYALSESLLRHYIQIAPDDPYGYNALGYLWLERGVKTDEAAPFVEKALHISGEKDAAIIDSMGWLRYRQGRLEEAEGFLRKALAKQYDSEIALHLAQVLIDRGEKAKAKKLLEQILQRNPKDAKASVLLKEVSLP